MRLDLLYHCADIGGDLLPDAGNPQRGHDINESDASRAILAIRSREVGATKDTSSKPYRLQMPSNSAFSSKGTSGKIRPSMPIRAQAEINRSLP